MNYECEGLARALFEESQEAQLLLDSEKGVILDANGAAQRLCGFSLRAILNTPIADIFHCDSEKTAFEFPILDWRVNLPFADWGYFLRAGEMAEIPVDVTITRLIVSPRPVSLLQIRAAGDIENVRTPLPGRSRMRHLLAVAPACLWCAEVTARGMGRFTYISPNVQQIAGRPAELIGEKIQNWRELIHANDRSEWDKALEQRRTGNSTQDEYRLVWPDGSERWVQDQARAVRGLTGSVWLYGVFTDITCRKQAEAPVRRLAELVKTADDAIITQTMDGLIVDWNHGAERLYGYSKEEVRSQSALRLFAPDSLDDYTDTVRRLRVGECGKPRDVAQIRKDGQRIKVSMRISPIEDGAGKLDGISIIARAIPDPNPNR